MAEQNTSNPHLTVLVAGQRYTLRDESGGAARLFLKAIDGVFVVKVDGGVIAGAMGRRCDYLLENRAKEQTWLVELKGTDSDSACEQIKETVALLRTHPVLSQHKRDSIRGCVVSPRLQVPDIQSTWKRRAFRALYQASTKREALPEDHLLFIRCVSSVAGSSVSRSSTVRLNANTHPFDV